MAMILDFFERAGDPNVLPRPEEDYRRSVQAGLFYMVEMNGKLVAAAGIFYLDNQNQGPLEMGSCYVAPEARGFGLQKVLIACRIAAATILLDVEAPIYTAIKPGNGPSLKSVKDGGFQPLTEPEPLLIEPCSSCNTQPGSGSGRICCCDFFYLPLRNRCTAIRDLLASKTQMLFRKTDSKQLKLKLAIQLLTNRNYRGAMRDFVKSAACRNA
jgi:hypothetical protein